MLRIWLRFGTLTLIVLYHGCHLEDMPAFGVRSRKRRMFLDGSGNVTVSALRALSLQEHTNTPKPENETNEVVNPPQPFQQPTARNNNTMCVTNTAYRVPQPVSFTTSQALLKASLPQPPVFPTSVPSVVNTATKPRSKRRRAPQKPGKTAKNQERHFVQHNYHDHALDEENIESSKPRRGGLAGSFPVKLHAVLSQVEADGFSHIISWQPHGRCFVIHQPKEFVEHIMPRYVI